MAMVEAGKAESRMGEDIAERTQVRNGVESNADMRTMNGNSWVVSYILGLAEEVVDRKKSVSLIGCVSQSGQVPRCPELGNSRGRNWGSWRLESGKQSVRNGMEVYISA